MARIPLADIPNAPNYVPNLGGVAPSPNRGAVAASFGRLADAVQQPLIPRGAFDGPAQGAAAIGQALVQASGVAEKIALRAAELRNDYQVIEANKAMQDAFAEFQTTLKPGDDPAQFSERWSQHFARVKDSITKNKALSPAAKQRIGMHLMQFEGQTKQKVAIQSHQAIFERAKSAYKFQYDDAVAMGDITGAQAFADQMVAEGLIFPEQGDQLKRSAQLQGNWNMVQSQLMENPASVPDLVDALDLPPEKKLQAKRMSEQEINRRQVDEIRDIRSRIEAGEEINEESIEAFGPHLNETNKRSMKTFLKTWNEETAGKIREMNGPDALEYAALFADIEEYRFSEDATHEKYLELNRRVQQIPGAYRGKLSQKLYAKYDNQGKPEKPNTGVRSHMMQVVERLYSHDMYAGFEKDDDGKYRKEDDLKVGVISARLTDKINSWLDANPEATAEEATKWLMQDLQNTGIMKLDKAKEKKPGFWNRLFGGSERERKSELYNKFNLDVEAASQSVPTPLPAPTPSRTPNPIEQPGAPVKTSAKPKATPVTFYSQGKDVGGPDELQDKWTNRGYTSTGPNLVEGVAAVNDSVYPLGTVFQDADTGEIFIAADRHGNRDKGVVDLYRSPENYTKSKQTRNLRVIAQIPRKEIPKTKEGMAQAISRFQENFSRS